MSGRIGKHYTRLVHKTDDDGNTRSLEDALIIANTEWDKEHAKMVENWKKHHELEEELEHKAEQSRLAAKIAEAEKLTCEREARKAVAR
jgi:hypothetical protein